MASLYCYGALFDKKYEGKTFYYVHMTLYNRSCAPYHEFCRTFGFFLADFSLFPFTGILGAYSLEISIGKYLNIVFRAFSLVRPYLSLVVRIFGKSLVCSVVQTLQSYEAVEIALLVVSVCNFLSL